ncbi:hypothetical protein FIU94_10290 [Sulfitobacter sp. THAF37]|uniref:hypothetical protein n=1 Tax=Sulfitobacter sp. THAF37 TaxID=2587855 RepID=UPI0012687A97|nr:hypothetical protein [Sulfitobacter sp. THAF37]QFT59214.1 hypothetical protein FIU94_10290 [Sulfitobacter sp. THAF37]
MKIACLHTADVHVQTFDALFAKAGFQGVVHHVVRADLLAQAREEGAAAVRADLRQAIAALGDAGSVLCTCSTLGPLIDDMSQADPRLLRIDRPLMEQAARLGGRILVVLCLESTRRATCDLLARAASELDRKVEHEVLLCAEVWALFEAGQTDAFLREIATRTRQALAEIPDISAVVLAQASMMGAGDYLAEVPVPVLSAPALAVDRAIGIARS